MDYALNSEIVLPDDGTDGTLVGRCWVPDVDGIGGPCVVA